MLISLKLSFISPCVCVKILSILKLNLKKKKKKKKPSRSEQILFLSKILVQHDHVSS